MVIGELLEFCKDKQTDKERKIMLFLENKEYTIPMINDYYIMNEVIFFRVSKIVKDIKDYENLTDKRLIELMEMEAMDSSWGDLYTSPMEHLGNCKLRFNYNIENENEDTFEIEKVTVTDNDIILIYLKENEKTTVEEIIKENLENIKNNVNINYQIETDIEKFIDLVKLGKDYKERLQILIMIYFVNPNIYELRNYTIEQVADYIKETEDLDKYRKYYVECFKAIVEKLI